MMVGMHGDDLALNGRWMDDAVAIPCKAARNHHMPRQAQKTQYPLIKEYALNIYRGLNIMI